MLSFAFSLLLSFVTSSTAVAPAGIVAPLVPVTGSFSVAVKRSPTLFVFVQTFDVDASVSVVPDAIAPTLPPEFFSPVVTVLPDAVRGGGAGSATAPAWSDAVVGRVGRGRVVAVRRVGVRRRRWRRRGRNVLELRLRGAVASRHLQIAVQRGILRERRVRLVRRPCCTPRRRARPSAPAVR